MKTARQLAFLAVLGGLTAGADELPFYKDGTAAPVRAAASVATSAQGTGLDSRTVQTVASAAIPFCSKKIKSTILLFR